MIFNGISLVVLRVGVFVVLLLSECCKNKCDNSFLVDLLIYEK